MDNEKHEFADQIHNEFVEKFREAGARALQYAWERNAVNILMEAEERRALEPDGSDPMTFAIVVNVLYRGRTQATVQVDKLAYKRTMKYCDDDFPEEVIDLNQLSFDFSKPCEQKANRADARPADNPRAMAVINAAKNLHCRAVLPCREGTVPNWQRSVRLIDEKEERIVLLPEGQEKMLLDTLADRGELVVGMDGMMFKGSIEKLVHNGYDVHLFDTQDNDMGTYDFIEDTDSPGYGKVALVTDFLTENNADEFISREDCIIANVY